MEQNTFYRLRYSTFFTHVHSLFFVTRNRWLSVSAGRSSTSTIDLSLAMKFYFVDFAVYFFLTPKKSTSHAADSAWCSWGQLYRHGLVAGSLDYRLGHFHLSLNIFSSASLLGSRRSTSLIKELYKLYKFISSSEFIQLRLLLVFHHTCLGRPIARSTHRTPVSNIIKVQIHIEMGSCASKAKYRRSPDSRNPPNQGRTNNLEDSSLSPYSFANLSGPQPTANQTDDQREEQA